MLYFSKQEDYVIVFLTELSKNYKKKLVPLSEIANNYKISALFLRNLAFVLRKNKIINAKEGKNGGYFLEKDPKVLYVGEVLSIFEKKPMLDCCSSSNKIKKSKCAKEKVCEVSKVWKKMNREFMDKISSLTFSDFIKDSSKVKTQKSKPQLKSQNY